jgi:hypothetical protein
MLFKPIAGTNNHSKKSKSAGKITFYHSRQVIFFKKSVAANPTKTSHL